MKLAWIIGLLCLAALLGGIFWMTQRPDALAGLLISLAAAALPGLPRIGDNAVLRRLRRLHRIRGERR